MENLIQSPYSRSPDVSAAEFGLSRLTVMKVETTVKDAEPVVSVAPLVPAIPGLASLDSRDNTVHNARTLSVTLPFP